ncbi:MAG TPA: hypothetical protein VJ302_33050 [Blastocatellia bacterium]|nr:hypothetical protein [Blastocatellia bacterium]
MRLNRSASIHWQLTPQMLLRDLFVAGLFTLVGFAAPARSLQTTSEVKLSVEDPRPVAQAILILEDRYGWVVTYEDPRYSHDSEISDVTLKVRRDLDKYKPGEAPKVFIPKGGALEFTYGVATSTNLPNDPAIVLQKLLDAQTASDHGGRFRIESSGKIMHVIPTAIKNRKGQLVPQESVLDMRISLPAKERTVVQKLEDVCAALSQATQVRVELGTIPESWFSRHRDSQGAVRQRARDILIDTFKTLDFGTNLSWRLLYGPRSNRYSLNIHLVSKRPN